MDETNICQKQNNYSIPLINGNVQRLFSQLEIKKYNSTSKNIEVHDEMTQKIYEIYEVMHHNSPNQIVKCENWSKEDSAKLFEYHSIYGNRWTKISTLFEDRSDNNVKNHFYSTLRKSHRIINKFIKLHRNKIAYRFLKYNILSKIICLSQKKSSSEYPNLLVSKSKDLLNKLVVLTQQKNEGNQSFIEEIIHDFFVINQEFKLTKKKKKTKLNFLQFNVSSQQQFLSPKKEVKQRLKNSCPVKLQSKITQIYPISVCPIQNCNIKEIQNLHYFPNNFISFFNNNYWMYNNPPQFLMIQQGNFYPQIVPYIHPQFFKPVQL